MAQVFIPNESIRAKYRGLTHRCKCVCYRVKLSLCHTGLLNGWAETKECLEKYLGVSLDGRTEATHSAYPKAAEALHSGQVIIF